ncbi:MAG: hypothetical protein QXN37_03335 [Candidatus Anstonellaceae archaeon]
MGDEELINYILRSRERGRTKDQIMRALLSVGWKKEKIESVFRKLDDPNYFTLLQQQAPSQQASALQQQASSIQASPQTQPMQPQPTQIKQQEEQAQQTTQSSQSQIQPKQKPFDIFSIFRKPTQEMQPQRQPLSSASAEQPPKQPQQQAPTQPFQFSQSYSIPFWIASSPTITVSLSSAPNPPIPPAKQAPIPQKPGLEEFAKNPAFSNLAAAISSSVQSKRSLLPFVLFAVFILITAAYIFIQQESKTASPPPQQSQINLTKLTLEKNNATKQNTTLTKPIVITRPPPNVTNRTIVTNQTKNTTPANTSRQPARNATQLHSKYESSQGFPPSVFCQRIDAALYRVHYTEFSDASCTKSTQKQDYIYPIDFPYACDEIPCCYPHGNFSRLYDWFECSHYS